MRWIWIQLHGKHESDSTESVLHAAGKPFLAGRHQLDDPRARPMMDESREHRAGRGQRPNGTWRQLDMLNVFCPPPPPPDGYEHLSWMYWNKEPAAVMQAAIDVAMTMDLDAKVLICVTEGYATFRSVIEQTRERWPGRVVVVHARDAWHAWRSVTDTENVPDEIWTWNNADLRYVTSEAKADGHWEPFLTWEGVEDRPWLEHAVLGDMAAIDVVIADATAVVGPAD